MYIGNLSEWRNFYRIFDITVIQNTSLTPIEILYIGNLSEWRHIYHIFNNTVNQNISLTPIEKFTYLLPCLKGEPLNV